MNSGSAIAETSLPRVVHTLLDYFSVMNPGAEPTLTASSAEGTTTLYPCEPAEEHGDAQWIELDVHIAPIDGRNWRLRVRADRCSGEAAATLAEAVGEALTHEREARASAAELSERYEEINLLYSINEIVGSVLAMKDATRRILAEVIEVLSARRASLWVYRSDTGLLDLAAAVGEDGLTGPIPIDDTHSATAWVFRENQVLNVERTGTSGESVRLEPRPRLGDAFLSVPINYTPPGGSPRTVGVLTLVGRRTGVRFNAGDERLLAAVASQIGAALETQRLVEETLRQERLLRELELAHDLQLKLLPDPAAFEGPPQIAARCSPAESVGGDFYQIYRLPGDRLGVLIGDVSSHGFAAALIMALTLSAVGIYARATESPAEVLRYVHRALIRELETTEMYLSLFYGVLDREGGLLSYANAGHPQAWRIDAGGQLTRLGATGPPLGTMPVEPYGERLVRWTTGSDLLLLFTDGLSDALADQRGSQSGESALVDEVIDKRMLELDEIVAHVFAESEQRRSGLPPDDRTMLLLRG